jgi:hypothetical protein
MNAAQTIWICTIAVTLLAAWIDWRTRRIPNWLTVPALVLGIAVNAFAAGWHGAKASLEGAGLALILLLPFVLKRELGAGDWKLMGAVGAFPGKAPGGVSLLLWDEADQSQAFEVAVDTDALGLSAKIHALFPAESIKVDTAKDVVILSGRVSSVAVSDKILELAKNVSPKVSSMLQGPVSPAGQIMLQVRFAEVNRVALSQFGLNILSLPGAKNGGTISTQQFSPPALVNAQNGVGTIC